MRTNYVQFLENSMEKRLSDVFEYLLGVQEVFNITDFAKKIGKGRSYVSEILNGKKTITTKLVKAITTRFPQISGAWILTGEGNMLLPQGNIENNISIHHSPHTNVATNNATITHIPQIDYGETVETELIPMLPMKLAKDPDVSVMDYIENPDRDLTLTPAVQQFPPTTCFKICNSDAMLPDLRPGDQLALAAISNNAPIVNGELYAIDAKDIGLVTRYTYDKGDYLELRASNPRYEPFRVKKKLVHTVFRVLGLIRSIL